MSEAGWERANHTFTITRCKPRVPCRQDFVCGPPPARNIRHKSMFRLLTSFILLALAAPTLHAQTPSLPSDVYHSVLRIEVATQVPDYQTPWNSGRFSGGIGTGFIIGKNKILTNAHVVSNARRVLITVHGSPKKYPAKVDFIAHDCDLALLSVEDFKRLRGVSRL